jgi:hypothetical protein
MLGIFRRITGSSVRRAAARQGRAAFLLPLTLIVPLIGPPPSIRYSSMASNVALYAVYVKLTVPKTGLTTGQGMRHDNYRRKAMIVNNLLIKLKDSSREKLEEAKNVLSGLKGNIPVLLDSRVELDINAGKSSYDLMLINSFNSAEDLRTYLDHPVHVRVSEYITPVMERAASLCYELK